LTNQTAASQAPEIAAVAEQGAPVAPEKAVATQKASPKKGAPQAKKGAKEAVPRKQAKLETKKAAKKEAKPAGKKASKSTKAAVPREFSKKAIVLDLLRRKQGATLPELAKATGWRNHSIRGFISGALTKKMGLTVESSKNDAGERLYRITG